MTAIIDYGAGNLFSVKNALDYIGADSIISSEKKDIENADNIILPGVGAFPDAMQNLREHGLTELIREQAVKKPFLGICLGMQMLFEVGFEDGETEGLALIPGCVKKISAPGLSIPHIGWNKLEMFNSCPILDGLSDDEYVYFVHSYRAACGADCVSAYCEYGENVPALVWNGKTIFGAQFHPEKSGDTGLKILKNFLGLEVV